MSMHPVELRVPPDGGLDGHGKASPHLETFCFQSSQPQLKRFIMVDQSGGKGRVFVHPSLAKELISAHNASIDQVTKEAQWSGKRSRELSQRSDEEQADARLKAFRQTVASAFCSLQAMRDIRRDSEAVPWSHVGPIPLAPARSGSSGTRRVSTVEGGSGKEDTEDLDALLSSDDEDEEVMSTAHSSEEQLADESYWSEEEERSKRRKLEAGRERKGSLMKGGGEEEDVTDKNRGSLKQEGLVRELKIKRTVKTLRNMIPGGPCLNAALVLKQTILYVKMLRDRINQLEATRSPNQA